MIAIGEFFSDRVDWHQDSRVSPLVRQYQLTLDSLLESHTALRQCDKHCLDCGIRFLSAPQNAGRADLRCPFGCAKRHRARQSNERVKAYRRTVWGKQKKDALNARRYRRPQAIGQSLSSGAETRDGSEAGNSSLVENRAQSLPAEPSAAPELDLDGVILRESTVVHSPLLPYIRTLLAMIEGIRMSHVEVVTWLRESQRQRSIAYRSRRDYVLRFLHQHPP